MTIQGGQYHKPEKKEKQKGRKIEALVHLHLLDSTLLIPTYNNTPNISRRPGSILLHRKSFPRSLPQLSCFLRCNSNSLAFWKKDLLNHSGMLCANHLQCISAA